METGIREDTYSYDRAISFVLKILACLLIAAAVTLALRPVYLLGGFPFFDDSYYLFSIARNIAMGKGITIDGHTWTNGFQPLYTFLLVPIFWLVRGDKYLALRYIFLLHCFFYLATACMIGIIARNAFSHTHGPVRKKIVFWLAVVFYLCIPTAFLIHTNGLETGCLLFFYSVAWWYYQKGRLCSAPGLVLFGVILGLLILVRIDTFFFIILISLYYAWQDRNRNFLIRARIVFTLLGVAFLISSPWWFYNLTLNGSPMPSSGIAQQEWLFSLYRITQGFYALSLSIMPSFYYGLPSRFYRLSVIADAVVEGIRVLLITGSAVFLWRRRFKLRQLLGRSTAASVGTPPLKLTAEFGWCLAVSTFILAAWYMLSSWVVFFYARYFCPQLLGFTLFGAYVLLKIYQRHAGAIFSFLVIIAILVFFRISLLQVGRPRGDYDYRHTQLVLVKEVVPDKDYVAAGQSGTLGYFRDRVVNLDGKVNAESLRFQNNMQEYLKEKKVYWVCDFTKYIRRYLGDEPEKHGWQLVGSKNGFFLYHYQGNS